nr:hypothetical protein CFP56_77029 [Quercus suber]
MGEEEDEQVGDKEVAQLIAEGEEIILSEGKAKVQSKEAKEEGFESLVREEDFEVFDHPDLTKDAATTSTPVTATVSTDQRATEMPEGMVIEKRLLDLLSLLESRASDATTEVPVVPRPLIPAPSFPPQTNPTDKKRKQGKKSGKGITDEGKIYEETSSEQTKGPNATKSQQKRGGEVTETEPKCRPRILHWNPPLVLDGDPFTSNSSIQNFDNERASYIANFVEQALLLPLDMAELHNLKKHEIFLSLKRDLALKAQAKNNKKLKKTLLKLTKCDRARKGIEAFIKSSERQVQKQLHHMKEAEDQFALA